MTNGSRQSEGRGHDRIAGPARSERAERGQQFRSRRTMDRAIHATAAHERLVRSCHQHLNRNGRDVAPHDLDPHPASFPAAVLRRTLAGSVVLLGVGTLLMIRSVNLAHADEDSTSPVPDVLGAGLDVYRWCMTRTNIDIDEGLVREVMRRYQVRTKREAVDLALRRLVGTPATRESLLALEGTGWAGDLDALRSETPEPQ